MGAGDFADYIEARGFPGFLHVFKALLLKSLEGVGGCTWFIGAAAQEGGSCLFHRICSLHKLVLGFNGAGTGHHGHGARTDVGVANRNHRVLRMEFFIDQFIGFRDSHYLVNAFADFNVGVQKLGLVADHAYDGNLGALGQMGCESLGFNEVCYLFDRFIRSIGFHNDNHNSVLLMQIYKYADCMDHSMYFSE